MAAPVGAAARLGEGSSRSMSGRGEAAPETTGAEALGLEPGDAVVHRRFGAGVVTHVEGEGLDARAEVRFSDYGVKRFLLAHTPLTRV